MVLRHPFHLPRSLAFCAILLLTARQVLAQDSFNCHITLDDRKYDLTQLAGEHNVSRVRDTPPTKFRDSVTFNLCQNLNKLEGVPDKEQVSSVPYFERAGYCTGSEQEVHFFSLSHSSAWLWSSVRQGQERV
jgi:hypothetical protein